MTTTNVITLEDVFNSCNTAAVACSGGVDSMTLAYCAHLAMKHRVTICHAVSPAVPPAATQRVKDYAAREGWKLSLLYAGEFDDENYMQNPANRCFFCKSNLYSTLAAHAQGAQLFSGTNTDDLGDWRPGLKAAANNDVRHPFVEAGLAKADVRALAARYGLNDIAELPSAPCLSSRIETGIRINVKSLRSIDRVETLLRDKLNPSTVRCRVRNDGLVIELDEPTLEAISSATKHRLTDEIKRIFNDTAHDIESAENAVINSSSSNSSSSNSSLSNSEQADREAGTNSEQINTRENDTDVTFAPYNRGSAFLKDTLR